MFQSTHPRGVRLAGGHDPQQHDIVSIHAPAWGATTSNSSMPISTAVSIHAPAWGATSTYQGMYCARAVSIHAPAWGATKAIQTGLDMLREFQSTHPRGVRPIRSSIFFDAAMFQSTHPRGVRPSGWRWTYRTWSGFNPRTRVGCDMRATCRKVGAKRFQSTHPRGVRRKALHVIVQRALVSIHAPAWGATPCRGPWPASCPSFNPRTRVGCDCFHVLSSRFP